MYTYIYVYTYIFIVSGASSGATTSGRRVGWERCRESTRCARDTYPESYNTKYTSMQPPHGLRAVRRPHGLNTYPSRNTIGP